MNKQLYDFYIIDRSYREIYRKSFDENLAERFSSEGLPDEERLCRRFELLCEKEVAHIHDFEKIVMLRTNKNIPDCFTAAEWEERRKNHFIHENGYVSNLCPNYAKVIKSGLLAVKETCGNVYQLRVIDAIFSVCDRYLEEAKRLGRTDLVEIFTRVPRYGARNFREALQFFRILHFFLWLEGDYHNTVGRFDVFMYPYFKADIDAGVYTNESALELIEDFFISFNKDSDIYTGVQQGDNGQSMVLGGMDKDGNEVFNLLSELCLIASEELKLIDPKINLRVSKKTPVSVFETCTKLTRAGLGFPQYSNDDVVIPALVKYGYDYEDAVDYVVAACWEFIIPGVGNDIANIGALNFPAVIDKAIRKTILTAKNFDEVLRQVDADISHECDIITDGIHNLLVAPSPLMDILRDGKKYNNFGIHGSGIASAADALIAVKKHVFDEKTISPERLISALDNNFESDPELLHILRFETPKMGHANSDADALAGIVMDSFANALEGKKNCLGGIFRAGTGTAMYYLWHAASLGATADGRFAGEPFGTNFSPSLFAKAPGPVSVIESFTAHSMEKNMNGGPLTLEFAASIFDSEESITKIAMLLKYFVERGGHQLQLNAVNLETMKAAQKNPELYRNLVVRIWGWSAYFVELDREFQNHVMQRQEFSV